MEGKDILVHPLTAIRLFAMTYLSFGELLLTDKRYKVTREAWIASMFLLGLTKNSGEEWFFKPEGKLGSPDFYSYSFTYNKTIRGTERHELKLEVFEYRKEESERDFLEALRKIKLNKIVDPNITIVCYIRRDQVIPVAVKLNQKLKQIKPKVKDIWYLGEVTADARTWRITQIYPNTLAIDLDYDEILTTKEKHSFIHAYRAKSNKFEYERTGKKTVLTPEFDFIDEE